MINPSEQVNFQDLVSRIAAEGRVEELSQQLAASQDFAGMLLALWVLTTIGWVVALTIGTWLNWRRKHGRSHR